MLRTLIVDDEAPARARLRRLLLPLEAEDRVRVVGEAADGVEALDRLADGAVDLLLLDIQMPGPSGFDVVDRLPPEPRPVVVFVTAFDRYAVQAFEAAAVDYLLKPVSGERLAQAVTRAERLAGRAGRAEHDERLADLLEHLDRPEHASDAPALPYLRHLTVPVGERLTVVTVDRILAAEVEEGLTRLFVLGEGASGRVARHTVPHALDALERRLDPEAFVRVHRAALVQIGHIREMIPWFSGRYKLALTGGHEVIASRTRAKDLRDRLSL